MNDWTLALLASAVFLAAFIAVQWPFADFLMTPCGAQLVLRQPPDAV